MKKMRSEEQGVETSGPGRVLARVLAEDMRRVQAGEPGWTIVVVQGPNGEPLISNRSYDHD